MYKIVASGVGPIVNGIGPISLRAVFCNQSTNSYLYARTFATAVSSSRPSLSLEP